MRLDGITLTFDKYTFTLCLLLSFNLCFDGFLHWRRALEGKKMRLLLNVGGPDRVSRVQMAETVADLRGDNKSFIKSVSASSVSIPFKCHL